jgi:ubiquinone/menaquinone biosynthesis C-methylase UbiE
MAKLEAQWLRDAVPRLVGAGARHLDFACGTGRITATLAPMVAESVGVDISESMLALARQKFTSALYVHADLTRDRVDIGEFDIATSFRFLGNAEHELRRAALAAIRQRLRTGGRLIVNSHRNPLSIGALLLSMRGHDYGMDLTYGKLARLLREQGFCIVDVHPIGVWLLRARLRTAAVLESPAAATYERLSSHRLLAPIAPDCIVVAQKAGEL